MMSSLLAVFLSVFSLHVASALNLTIPFEYPLFKQCDQRWGEDIMVTKTICAVGCLMSSTSMGLAGTEIPIRSGKTEIDSTPKTFNEWLKLNDGYDDSNDMIETQVPLIDPSRIFWPDDGMHRDNDLTYSTIVSYLEKGRIVIGNVMDGGHFVLLTGYSLEDMDTFAVNDPGFDQATYSYKNDIVGYRIFDMIRV